MFTEAYINSYLGKKVIFLNLFIYIRYFWVRRFQVGSRKFKESRSLKQKKKTIKKRAFKVQMITEVLYNKICRISKYLEKK